MEEAPNPGFILCGSTTGTIAMEFLDVCTCPASKSLSGSRVEAVIEHPFQVFLQWKYYLLVLLLMSAVEFLELCTCLAFKSLSGSSDRTSFPGLFAVEVPLVLLVLLVDIKCWWLNFRTFVPVLHLSR